jgi:GDP/UDP-N,N'-diacetylbacillosamine 2-epimerase (hydrolysing)
MRQVLGVTGIRSEYDIMSSVYRAIDNHPELSLSLAVTGAHLSEQYGLTVKEIKQDGFNIVDEIESLLNSSRIGSRVKGLAIQLQSLVQTVERVQPDFLIVLGDREESITTALIGAYMNIPVVHVAGGDRVVGNVDDQVRHAVTKLAHIHCATNEESAERMIRMGEQPFRVHVTGNPGLDRLVSVPEMDVAEVGNELDFPLRGDQPFLLLIQHVISTEIEEAFDQMSSTLKAVASLGIPTIMSYPNSDVGSHDIIRAIDQFRAVKHLKVVRNIPRHLFVNIMRKASCMIGNSSAGIMEAPLLHLPVVNIGNRQKERLHANNVQFVSHDTQEIIDAVTRAVFDNAYRELVETCENPYGDGHSSERIANIIAATTVDKKILVKDVTY